MSTSHRYISLSSMRPAENPSTGFLFNSAKREKDNWREDVEQSYGKIPRYKIGLISYWLRGKRYEDAAAQRQSSRRDRKIVPASL